MIALEAFGRRGTGKLAIAVQSPVRRTHLVWIAAAGYLAFIGSVTWQALRGQSLIHPDDATLASWAVILVAMAGSSVLVLTHTRSAPRNPVDYLVSR